ncbi:TonB-dependent siderophore receptor [Insolitispirillum peregrinum]|uniref:Iron complex outermembrane recepter protein n=1 Tax=Insolitispirillum peregrinum TaxID=80876 RepID=A0A1N7NCG7_9PROT|nr:TonB-dependent siderophore receptor [Insolitispirillum peregrinum]SIS96093.1 iron complex outermembrane recepter protein [Insolitispirillum peregrinum]
MAPSPLQTLLRSLSLSALLVAASCLTPANAQQQDPAAKQQDKSDEAAKTDVTLQPVSVTADDASTAPTDGYRAVSTSTATRSATPLLDIPQAVNVVSQTVLRDQAATSLDDALANVSGITQTNTLGGTQDAIIRRGFGENRDGSILINGQKTSLPRSFNVMTERVEVLKGPASTLYGILDPGGMINVVTKKPEHETSGEVYTRLSSFGGGSTGFGVTAPVADTAFAVRLDGEYENSTYWRSYGEIDRQQIAPSIRWTGSSTDVTLSYFHEKYSVPFDRGTVIDLNTGKAIAGRSTRLDEPYNITKGTSDMVQLEAKQALSSAWDLGFNYSYSVNEYSDNQARVTAYNPVTGRLTRRADATQDATTITHSARTDLTGKADIGGLRNDLLFGVSYDDSDTLRTNMLRCATSSVSAAALRTGALASCNTVSNSDSDQTEKLSTVSAYTQDSLHLDEQWILVGGLRYQYYDAMAGKGRPFVTNSDSAGNAIIPNGGIVYKLTPEVSLYTNVARTFRPQVSVGSYIGDLQPEKGLSYEIGSKVDLGQRFSGTVALYNASKKNVAYTETVNGETVAKAAGRVRSRGIEVDVSGALTDHLNLIASYGLTDTRVMKDVAYAGNRLPNVARHTGSLYLSYDLDDALPGSSDVKVGGGVRAASQRAGAANNSFFLPAYAVTDLFASYTLDLKTPLTLQLNLNNIFDTTYYTSSIGSNNLSTAVGEPFNAVLSVRAEF